MVVRVRAGEGAEVDHARVYRDRELFRVPNNPLSSVGISYLLRSWQASRSSAGPPKYLSGRVAEGSLTHLGS